MCARLLAAVVAIVALLPGVVYASAFTVVVTLNPIAGGYIVQVHTRIGATCDGTTSVPTRSGTRKLTSQHVGSSGIVHWTWLDDVRIGAYANITCTWKGQKQNGDALKLPPMPSANKKLVLGSTRADWISVLGTPTETSDHHAGWWYCFFGVTPRITIYDSQGKNFVSWISAGPCRQTTVSKQQWLAEAAQFLPADAVYMGTRPGDNGTDYEYTSASIGHLFFPYQFIDCSGNQTQPGTISIRLGSAGDSTDTGWDMQLGTCT